MFRIRTGMEPCQDRPINRLSEVYYPALNEPLHLFILFALQASYFGVHLAGWNLAFPTEIEHRLWHVCSIMQMGCMVTVWTVDLTVWHIFPRLNSTAHSQSGVMQLPAYQTKQHRPNVRQRTRKFFDVWRNNSPDQDPDMTVKLKALLPVTVAAIIYCFARSYVLMESLVSLRALPASAYASVNWSTLIPHF